ncbi:hypothetical protein MSG28_012806 [Choristoneura fumiferana]|uniref:Uncharacterized protein n=1 Tax=Choristoneura fumiferana TaxID=7141 RepID=A0ACC0JHZ6_CHOFU|nr:hypothetical protein MSG28_012806 [Choristoneura fumiferana]
METRKEMPPKDGPGPRGVPDCYYLEMRPRITLHRETAGQGVRRSAAVPDEREGGTSCGRERV